MTTVSLLLSILSFSICAVQDSLQIACASCPQSSYTTASGTINSPNWPGLYCDSLTCTYTISPPQPNGSFIALTFNAFQTELGYDWLYAYEGSNQARQLGQLSGQSVRTPFTVFSSWASPGMFLSFAADGSVAYQGFSATYAVVTNPCGATSFTGTSGSFSSPNYPNYYYPRGLSCTYTITGPANMGVGISFSFGSTNPGVDIVTINGKSGQASASYSGSSGWNPYTTTGNTLTVTFTSSATTSGNYRGWSATWNAVPLNNNASCGSSCGGFYANSGTISSPNYPGYYCNGLNCAYSIIVPSGSYASITITNFSTEAIYDTLTIYDNPNLQDDTTKLALFSGSIPLPVTLYSAVNGLAVKFVTDNSYVSTGWSAYFQSVPNICGNNAITGDNGTISSLNYPYGNYPDNLQCQWTVTVDENNYISVTFLYFQTEANADVLTLFDGVNNVLVGRYSGSFNGSVNISSNVLQVTFTSNYIITNPGWLIQWASFNPTPPCGCGRTWRTISSPNGQNYLSSPNYPNPYCAYEDCTWYLQVPPGYDIAYTFGTFNSKYGYDVLTVFDGFYNLTTPANQLEQCTGEACGGRISTHNIITVTFVANPPTQANLLWQLFFHPVNNGRRSEIEEEKTENEEVIYEMSN